jgi:hypothetical protein
MKRVWLGLLGGVALGVGLTHWWDGRQQSPFAGQDSRRLELFREENVRLHALVEEVERAKAQARARLQSESVERSVVEIRGLKFKTPVDYQPLDRKQIKATIAGKISEVFTEQEFTNQTLGLWAAAGRVSAAGKICRTAGGTGGRVL